MLGQVVLQPILVGIPQLYNPTPGSCVRKPWSKKTRHEFVQPKLQHREEHPILPRTCHSSVMLLLKQPCLCSNGQSSSGRHHLCLLVQLHSYPKQVQSVLDTLDSSRMLPFLFVCLLHVCIKNKSLKTLHHHRGSLFTIKGRTNVGLALRNMAPLNLQPPNIPVAMEKLVVKTVSTVPTMERPVGKMISTVPSTNQHSTNKLTKCVNITHVTLTACCFDGEVMTIRQLNAIIFSLNGPCFDRRWVRIRQGELSYYKPDDDNQQALNILQLSREVNLVKKVNNNGFSISTRKKVYL